MNEMILIQISESQLRGIFHEELNKFDMEKEIVKKGETFYSIKKACEKAEIVYNTYAAYRDLGFFKARADKKIPESEIDRFKKFKEKENTTKHVRE